MIRKRELGSLSRVQQIQEANPNLPCSDTSDLLKLASISNLPPPLHNLLLYALQHRDADRHLHSCLLLLPLVEAVLRLRYVAANNCPHRLITAEATELYTTFTEMLTLRSKLEEEVGGDLLLLMVDLLILPSGPRARDRLSHGEIAVEKEEEKSHLASLGSILVAILLHLLSPSSDNPLLPLIQSAFHPAARLAKSILSSFEALASLEKVELAAREEVEKVEKVAKVDKVEKMELAAREEVEKVEKMEKVKRGRRCSWQLGKRCWLSKLMPIFQSFLQHQHQWTIQKK